MKNLSYLKYWLEKDDDENPRLDIYIGDTFRMTLYDINFEVPEWVTRFRNEFEPYTWNGNNI